MYWSYLYDSTKSRKSQTLTFESSDNLEKLILGYCELTMENFFSCFSPDFDSIFISEFSPDKKPLENEFKFVIKFNDITKAKSILKINCISK